MSFFVFDEIDDNYRRSAPCNLKRYRYDFEDFDGLSLSDDCLDFELDGDGASFSDLGHFDGLSLSDTEFGDVPTASKTLAKSAPRRKKKKSVLAKAPIVRPEWAGPVIDPNRTESGLTPKITERTSLNHARPKSDLLAIRSASSTQRHSKVAPKSRNSVMQRNKKEKVARMPPSFVKELLH